MKFTKKEIKARLSKACVDAAKNVRQSKDVKEFNVDLDGNLDRLAEDIYTMTYDTTFLRCFIINDPVKREIFAPNFRDRIVSHFLYDMVGNIFEKTFIDNSFSCRKGKGTHYGIETSVKCMRRCSQNYTKETYILQGDISGYFMSINNSILYRISSGILNRYRYRTNENGIVYDDILDFELIDFLSKKIIFRKPLEKCVKIGKPEEWDDLPANKSLFNSPIGVGMIIGDLMSQVYSNVYLGVFDNYVVYVKKIRYYGRYVDDFFAFSNNREELENLIPDFIEFLNSQLGLTLHKKKTKIINIRDSYTFLGFVIHPYYIVPKRKTVSSMRRRLYKIVECDLKEDYRKMKYEWINSTMATINSFLGHLRHANTYNIKKGLIEKNPKLSIYYDFDSNYEKVTIKKEIKEYFAMNDIQKENGETI